MKKEFLHVSMFNIFLASTMLAGASTYAKEAGDDMKIGRLEEIVVTAQRREENIQKVALAVTAISDDELQRGGVNNITDLAGMAPNVRMGGQMNSDSTAMITIRGLTNYNPNVVKQSPVGLYLDGFYISRLQGSNLDLVDLDRVEVLRGPQGTLFGRDTIGGAVSLITKKPTDESDLIIQVGVGNYNAVNGRATLNLPLIQSSSIGSLSLRQTVLSKTRDGYVDNKSPTSVLASGANDFNDLDRITSTTGLRWQPSDNITVDYMFFYQRWRNSIPAFQVGYIYPNSSVSSGPFDLHPYLRENRVDEIGNNATLHRDLNELYKLADDGKQGIHTLTAKWDLGEVGFLGDVTVTSISGYRSVDTYVNEDADGNRHSVNR